MTSQQKELDINVESINNPYVSFISQKSNVRVLTINYDIFYLLGTFPTASY